MNDTILKFDYPASLVAEYGHWLVLLRPTQPTVGSLVLAAKSDTTALGALPAEAFAEMGRAIADIETALRTVVGYDRINYLTLMMVDPHVHTHVIPRYEGARAVAGVRIADEAWGKPPALADAYTPNEAERDGMLAVLKANWPG